MSDQLAEVADFSRPDSNRDQSKNGLSTYRKYSTETIYQPITIVCWQFDSFVKVAKLI